MRVAVVEDDSVSRENLVSFIKQYGQEHHMEIQVDAYENGWEAVEQYQAVYDILFLDIEMPKLDGMRAAREIRDIDESVMIVFVTNMAKYAVKGYEVGALDYILKPIQYPNFSLHMDRFMRGLAAVNNVKIQLKDRDSIYTLRVSSIEYVEVEHHRLHYHTFDNEYVVRGTIKEAEQLLDGHHFSLCNSGYLVNLKHVRSIVDGIVLVGNQKLTMSRGKKKSFVQALSDYMTEAYTNKNT
ncbi:MAG: LytTR family DNA-binding domain-containing protein [Eubacteriales bacterium]|nr:LytTR family DNA-binding domain-containing protein [Eubacteriales bacterium]